MKFVFGRKKETFNLEWTSNNVTSDGLYLNLCLIDFACIEVF